MNRRQFICATATAAAMFARARDLSAAVHLAVARQGGGLCLRQGKRHLFARRPGDVAHSRCLGSQCLGRNRLGDGCEMKQPTGPPMTRSTSANLLVCRARPRRINLESRHDVGSARDECAAVRTAAPSWRRNM
jgi:hypothetical protein